MNAPGGCNQHQNHIFWRLEKKTPFRVGPLEKAFFGQTSKKNVVKADPGITYIKLHVLVDP